MTTDLFPKLSYQSIAPILEQTPFLNLEWHFQTYITDLKEYVAGLSSVVDPGVDFKTYQASQIQMRSPLAKIFAEEDLRGYDLDEFDIYIDYVIGLRKEDVTQEALIGIYRRFHDSVASMLSAGETELLVSYPNLASALLSPVLKWFGHDALLDGRNQLVAEIERTIEIVAYKLEGPSFNSDLLMFQNNLIFCYLVVTDCVGTGVVAKIFSHHLRVHRRVSPGRWEGTPSRVRMQYATLMLHYLLRFYRPEKAFHAKQGFSINVLADVRSMLEDAASTTVKAPFTSHQWVFRWFKDKLDAEVFTPLRGTGALTSLGVLSESEQNLAVELCRRFGSYRVPITITHMEHFLLQFGSTQRIRGALRLLTHIKFYPLWELAAAVEKILVEELRVTGALHLVIAPFGEQTGSTAIIRYLASHSVLAGQLKFAPDLSSALAETSDGDSIYFVDDCLLSGTQTLNILGDLMGTRLHKPHHTVHSQELIDTDKKKLCCRSLCFVYSLITDIGIHRFNEGIAATGINVSLTKLVYSVMEHSTSKAFEPLGPVSWASADERDELKQFCSEIGYEILAERSREKGWYNARRMESALGFSDFQRLLVFPYNVPKTTVTLLWERGTLKFPWSPLFFGFD